MKSLSLLTLLLLIVTGITGCSDTENPLEPTALTENTATGIFAEAKHIESVPAAPTAPQAPIPPGTPTVTEIGYYSDWQRTKPITGNVAPTDLRLTNNTFYREDGIGTKIGRLVITDEDRQNEEHQVSITQGGAYVGYDDNYLHVLQLFDRATKEIAVEVVDPAGLTYTETFEIRMKDRPTQPSEPSDPTPSSQDDEPSDASTETTEPGESTQPNEWGEFN